jgi:hypothetical protein
MTGFSTLEVFPPAKTNASGHKMQYLCFIPNRETGFFFFCSHSSFFLSTPSQKVGGKLASLPSNHFSNNVLNSM